MSPDEAIAAGITLREADASDLPAIVRLLAQLYDDPAQEDYAASRDRYHRAYAEIKADRRQTLFVAEHGAAIVGSLALIVVPNLTRRGRPYAIIENVVVDAAHRSEGIGEVMMRSAIDAARVLGCHKVALMSRVERREAHRFYERLGFKPAHVGFRLDL